MLGAICGDIIGVPYEFQGTKDKNFPMHPLGRNKPPTFSDDTVCTVAVANTLMNGVPYVDSLHSCVRQELMRGYGGMFAQWVKTGNREPYKSYGNGSAMRVSPVAWFHDTLDDVLAEAKRSADVTHNHVEGVKGAQSVAHAIFLARTGASKADIKNAIETNYKYNLDNTCEEIRLWYDFDVTCQGSVPEAITCFLESTDWEDAVRNAVSLGGDADTQGAIAGSIAEAYYSNIPQVHIDIAMRELNDDFKKIVLDFDAKYVKPKLRK